MESADAAAVVRRKLVHLFELLAALPIGTYANRFGCFDGAKIGIEVNIVYMSMIPR